MKKNDDFREILKNMWREWKWVFRYVGRYKFIIILYVLLGIIGTGTSLGAAVASKYLVDTVVSHDSANIARFACLTIGLAIFQFVFSAGSQWISAIVGTKANNEMREEIYSHILSSRWEDIHTYHSGDLLNRIEGDVATVSSGVISFIPSVFTKVLQFGGSLCIVLYYDKIMALLALLSAPFMFLISRLLVRTMRKFNKQSRELNGKVISFSQESIRNIHIIKAFDLTGQYIENFREVLSEYRKVRLGYERFSVLMTLGLSVIGLGVSYLCYGWGVYRLWQGLISYGTMTLFLQIAGNLSSSFSSVAGLFPTAITIATSAGRVMEFTDFEKERDLDADKAKKMLKKSRQTGVSVIAENVTFAYSDSVENVLNEISFSARPGETIGFVGSSGEGKTTCLKLLLGLVGCTSGKLCLEYEGEELAISDSTRRFFSYIPQETGLFSGTVAENLRLVKTDATDGELIAVLKAAEIWEFVSASGGLDTVIGEQGENLSAGQVQRIAIARSLLKKAPVLLMDEATSALDEKTEGKVLENIMRTDPTQVCILTTHRKSMLKYCDRVYRINSDGTMSAETHREAIQ